MHGLPHPKLLPLDGDFYLPQAGDLYLPQAEEA